MADIIPQNNAAHVPGADCWCHPVQYGEDDTYYHSSPQAVARMRDANQRIADNWHKAYEGQVVLAEALLESLSSLMYCVDKAREGQAVDLERFNQVWDHCLELIGGENVGTA
jgi:hypothetical protein